MDANSWQYQQQAIDAEIKLLEETTRVLKYRRNALAPISSLPTEVTTRIFSFLHPTSSAFTPDKKPDPDPLAWLRVTHICHHWREIALNEPLFWSHIDFRNLSSVGIAEVIARAKTAPLYLEARFLSGRLNYRKEPRFTRSEFDVIQENLQACVSRICHLLFSADMPAFSETLKGLISPAPTLERLSLSCKHLEVYSRSKHAAIPETLFSGITPRLSCLELRRCDISWKSPLLRGLTYLDIRSPSACPRLSVWLDALDEMPQLQMFALHEASPLADDGDRFLFDVKRTATLPSLTHFDISDSPLYCALTLSHLNLPALTCLSVKTFPSLRDGNDVRDIFPYIAQHAHGSQDAQPLQSVLIRGKHTQADFLAWPVPNIDVEEQGSTLLAKMGPARVALYICNKDSNSFDARNEIFGLAMAAIPLDGLVTFITQGFRTNSFRLEQHRPPNLPNFPLLRHMRLVSNVATRFIDWLQADDGGREGPLLPSLKELVVDDDHLREDWTLRLCELLMKRVEQGVPLEMLDLRTCDPDPRYPAAVRLLGEIVVNVLGPETPVGARHQRISMWDRSPHGSFVRRDDSVVMGDDDEV